jgi:MinD-like ATPase involved in chromosome partitioning or flagellar assembly
MTEFVVVNSPSLQAELAKLRIPVSGGDAATASQQIYQLALTNELAGIIVAPPLPPELVEWLSSYADRGVPMLMLGDQLGITKAQVLPLPSTLPMIVNVLGYGNVLTDVPPLDIDQRGAIVASPANVVGQSIPVLFSVSGKGGVGKTTIGAIQTASFAHQYYGARVLLVDGNAGQGDVRRYLKLGWNAANLPDISHYETSHSWSDIVITSAQLQGLSSHGNIPFDVILAPSHGAAHDVKTPPAGEYLRLIQSIESDPSRPYDLIVVDTQIVETNYTSPMVYGFIVPLIQRGAFVVGVFDNSTPGYNNTRQALKVLSDASHAGGDQFAFIANKLSGPIQTINGAIDGIWLAGQIPDSTVVDQIVAEIGDPQSSPELYSTVARLLNRILGAMPSDQGSSQTGSKKGLPSFLRRRRT